MAKGFGEARENVPATTRTAYHIGSLTKQFTAAAVLKLIEEGARAPFAQRPLTLDTQLSDVFEGVEGWASPEQQPITVRTLLSMTSNLPNFTRRPPEEVDPWGAVETSHLLAAIKRQRPHGWPNTFEYSNTSYFLLAQIVEAVLRVNSARQVTLRDYVRDLLLRPAGMSHSGFIGEPPMDSVLAEPHYQRRPAFAQPHWLDGCADMVSNADDMFAWNTALMDGGVLGSASRAAMFSDAARVDPITYYGMGWYIAHENGSDTFHHSGSVPGYTSFNAIKQAHDGSWASVTLLTNSDGVEGLDQLADNIFLVIHRSLPRTRR